MYCLAGCSVVGACVYLYRTFAAEDLTRLEKSKMDVGLSNMAPVPFYLWNRNDPKRVKWILFVHMMSNFCFVANVWIYRRRRNRKRNGDIKELEDQKNDECEDADVKQMASISQELSQASTHEIKNPLILLIGISIYDEATCDRIDLDSELEGVKLDIAGYQSVFKESYHYKHVYSIDEYIESKFRGLNKWSAPNPMIIKKFCNHYLYTSEVDGLLVCFSGHGFENDWILCGNGETLSLFEIKNYFKDILNVNIPKYFLMGCCREGLFLKKFIDVDKENMKKRGRKTYHSNEESLTDSTNQCTLYATSNYQSAPEDTKKGEYMHQYICEQLKTQLQALTNQAQAGVSMNNLIKNTKRYMKQKNGQICEQRDSMMVGDCFLVPNTQTS